MPRPGVAGGACPQRRVTRCIDVTTHEDDASRTHDAMGQTSHSVPCETIRTRQRATTEIVPLGDSQARPHHFPGPDRTSTGLRHRLPVIGVGLRKR